MYMTERNNRADFYPVSHHDINYTDRELMSKAANAIGYGSNKRDEIIQDTNAKDMINNPQNTDNTTSIPTQPTRLDGTLVVQKSMCLPTASEQFVIEIDPAAMEQIAQAMATINQRISDHFNKSTRDLFIGSGLQQNPLNKCQDCVWFHKTAKFCAVAPKNLTSLECGDRQIPEPPENLDYLEARSPERIALIQELAQGLGIRSEMLEQKLFQGCLNTNEPFGLRTLGLLSEIETIGAYSIAQMELIRDGLRCGIGCAAVAKTIKEMILKGCSFNDIMRWLLFIG
jgi:hypothetical protein